MIKTLLNSLKPAAKPGEIQASRVATPDLNRILKLPEAIIIQEEPPHITPGEANAEPDLEPVVETRHGTPDEMAERAAAAVDSLAGQYDTWMEADLQRLGDAWETARDDAPNPDNSRVLFMTAHNIRGVASSYGYPAISRLCGSLCKLLADSKPGTNLALINIHIEACTAAYNPLNQTDGANVVAEAVCAALEAKVELMIVS